MIFDHRVHVNAPVERVWAFLGDMPAVSRCVPGVQSFTPIDENTFEGSLKLRVGPIGVTLRGRAVVVERDEPNLQSRLEVSAVDERVASNVKAKTTMTLTAHGPETTELHIYTDASVLGKLGEFGQPVLRRKADQVIREFSDNVSRELAKPAEEARVDASRRG